MKAKMIVKDGQLMKMIEKVEKKEEKKEGKCKECGKKNCKCDD